MLGSKRPHGGCGLRISSEHSTVHAEAVCAGTICRLALGNAVAGVDGWPGSQDPDSSFMHAMHAPGQTMEQFEDAVAAYQQSLYDMKSVDGSAGFLREMQDSYSR